MSSLIPAAISLGQQDAQNPGINYNQFASQLSAMDPVGNAITKIGGDPLNLYGNKNDPNALIFPSQNPNAANGGMPAVLPTLAGVGAPKTYDPNSFGGYANLGSGPFNAMAAQMAGPMYQPTLMRPSTIKGAAATAPTGIGLVPGYMGRYGRSTMPILNPQTKAK